MGIYGSPELGFNNNASWENNMIFCSKCGTRYSKKIRKCPQCGKKHAQPFYNKLWFWVLVVFVIFAFYPQQNRIENQEAENIQPAISEEEYKSNCVTVPYSDAARNPNEHNGKFVVYDGQVVQVQENGNSVMLRVNVTQNEYGSWEDTVYVDYQRKTADEPRVLESDIITMYGKLNGIKSYEAVFGNQISIPHLIAEYVVIN